MLKYYPLERDLNSLLKMREILSKSDKDLYRKIRSGKLTFRQVRARYLEKLNGRPIVDYDDIKHLIRDELKNLDRTKVNEFSVCAFGKPLGESIEN